MKKMLYAFYKKFENNKFCATPMFLGFDILNNIKNFRLYRKNENEGRREKDVRAVIISDEMTYENFKSVCDLKFLTPQNSGKMKLRNLSLTILICESVLQVVIDKYKDIWRGKIYKNKNLIFENRKTLFKIIEYCRKNNIKTAFWNKRIRCILMMIYIIFPTRQ